MEPHQDGSGLPALSQFIEAAEQLAIEIIQMDPEFGRFVGTSTSGSESGPEYRFRPKDKHAMERIIHGREDLYAYARSIAEDALDRLNEAEAEEDDLEKDDAQRA